MQRQQFAFSCKHRARRKGGAKGLGVGIRADVCCCTNRLQHGTKPVYQHRISIREEVFLTLARIEEGGKRSSVFGKPLHELTRFLELAVRLRGHGCGSVVWFRRPQRLMGRRKRVEEEEAPEMDEPGDTSESRSLYEVLGVSSNASHEEIRRAYHKSALRLHPDKNPGDEDAKEKFQQLQNVMAILGDPEKRELYDQTGSIDAADIDGDAVKSLYKFLRTLFKQVTEEDIDVFSASYRGSKEEEKDLLAAYTKFKGDFKKVFNQMMCSDPQVDSHRYMDTIDAAIAAGELKEYKVYRKWATEVSKSPRPTNPLGPSKKKKKKNGESTSELAALINHRGQKQMDSLASALAAKYGNKGKGAKGGKSSKPVEEPSEEEFLAAQKRVMKKSKK